ncbi:AraC family transcriptional regulator [Alkalispirochaeta alkalica]|uniref:AraC family transcriptional regulator n=1 Tax=Alkalispirochaeta alkalica TaxID=46356 RepID=UPI00036E52F8|nr:AraC family transcriptional regulator [Alkalispirochaeta alkalica]
MRRYDFRDDSGDEAGAIPPESEILGSKTHHFFSDTNPRFKLLFLSKSKFENDWHSVPHTHFFSEMFYVMNGEGQFFANNHTVDINSDSLVIVNANVEHTEISTRSENPLEYIVLGIEGLQFDFGPEDRGFSVADYRDAKMEMRFLFLAMLHEMRKPGSALKKNYCQNVLNLIMINIMRHKSMGISISPPRKACKECARVKEYIDQNMKSDINLDQLAKIAHLNKYYMSHTFTKTYGISPINYLLEKRIEECKHLIDSTDLSLSQISSIVGFSSSSYFSQSFKRIVKISPREYRRRVKTASFRRLSRDVVRHPQ